MDKILEDYKHIFDILNQVRYRSDEYYVHGNKLGADKKKIPTGNINFFHNEGLVKDFTILNKETCASTMLVEDEAVTRFHPSNIDNKNFWKVAKEEYPLLSVCGHPSKTIKEVNKNTTGLPTAFKFLDQIDDVAARSTEPINLIEIGFGYGNIFDLYNGITNYTGIDYTVPRKLKKHDNLHEIDVSGVPENLAIPYHYDVVYSCNVFQHCSQEDRFEYLKQAYDMLKVGGYMMFSAFIWSNKNKNEPYWGIGDMGGRYYTQFFSQLTEVDTENEIRGHLHDLGFNILRMTTWKNCWGFIIQK